MSMEKGTNVERMSGVSAEGTSLAQNLGDMALQSHNAALTAQVARERTEADKWMVTQQLDSQRKDKLADIQLKEAEMTLTKGLTMVRAKMVQAQQKLKNALLTGDMTAAQGLQNEIAKYNDQMTDISHKTTRLGAALTGWEKIRDGMLADGGKAIDGYVAGEHQKKKSLENIALRGALSHLYSGLKAPSEQDFVQRNAGIVGDVAGALTGQATLGLTARMAVDGTLEEENRGMVRSAIANYVTETTGLKDPQDVNSVVSLVQLMHKMAYQKASPEEAQQAQEAVEALKAKGVDTSDLGRVLTAVGLGIRKMKEGGMAGVAQAAAEYGVAPDGEKIETPFQGPEFQEKQKVMADMEDYVSKIQMGANSLGIPAGTMNSAKAWMEGNGANLTSAMHSIMEDLAADGVIDKREELNKLPPQLKNILLAKEAEARGKMRDLQLGGGAEELLGVEGVDRSNPEGFLRARPGLARKKLSDLQLQKDQLAQKATSFKEGSPASVAVQRKAYDSGTADYDRAADGFLGEIDNVFSEGIHKVGGVGDVYR